MKMIPKNASGTVKIIHEHLNDVGIFGLALDNAVLSVELSDLVLSCCRCGSK